MNEILSNPIWQGIGAVFAALTFLAYLLAEWKRLYDGSKELAEVSKAAVNKIFPNDSKEKVNRAIYAFAEAMGGLVGVIFLSGWTSVASANPIFILHSGFSNENALLAERTLNVAVFYVPFLMGISSLKKKPKQWATVLGRHWVVTMLYYLALFFVTTIIFKITQVPTIALYDYLTHYFVDAGKDIGYYLFRLSEFSAFAGVLTPIAWASVYQRAGKYEL